MGTACLDLDGKVIWKNDTIHYSPVHGNGGSPIIVDDKLVFSCDGGDKAFIIALSRETGKMVWKTDRRPTTASRFSFSTPTLIAVKGQKQIISPASGAVYAYEPARGRKSGACPTARVTRSSPSPSSATACCLSAPAITNRTCWPFAPDGKGDVTETHIAWQTDKFAPHTPSPLLVGDELYMVSDAGTVSCSGRRTGKVHWQERMKRAAPIPPRRSPLTARFICKASKE